MKVFHAVATVRAENKPILRKNIEVAVGHAVGSLKVSVLLYRP
jgi:hypothetical protein